MLAGFSVMVFSYSTDASGIMPIGRLAAQAERRHPVETDEPADNSNLAETNRDRPAIGSNTVPIYYR